MWQPAFFDFGLDFWVSYLWGSFLYALISCCETFVSKLTVRMNLYLIQLKEKRQY